jgi:hypothetical protein
VRVATWITDLRHLPPPGAEGIAQSAQERAQFTRKVIEAATSRHPEGRWVSALRCVARVGRKRCRGRVEVELEVDRGAVEWSCVTCDESGVVSGFVGSDSDFSRYVPGSKEVNWGVDDEERQVLLDATVELPELLAVIARTKPHAEVPGLLLVRATVEELDQIYTLVEELTDLTRSRKRRKMYDGLRMSLSSSIDGF